MTAALEAVRKAKAHANGEDESPPSDDGFTERELRVYTVSDLLNEAAVRARSKEQFERGTTGHSVMDKLTGGLRPGHAWVLAAETSWGKSSMLISMVDENLKRGKRALIVSFEDPRSMYADRLLCRRAKVNAQRLRDKCLTDAEIKKVGQVATEAEAVPVYVEADGEPIESLTGRVEALIRRERIDLVAWDYLQETQTSKRYQDERVRFREAAAKMRNVGRRTDCCTLILSQITEQTGKKYPDKNSVRECRDVSNAAEHILIGFTPKENIVKDGKVLVVGGTKCIKVDKSKDGIKGTVAMQWNEESACFDAVMPTSTKEVDHYEGYFDNETSSGNAPDDSDRRYP
jgi:replicative DNA helicase